MNAENKAGEMLALLWPFRMIGSAQTNSLQRVILEDEWKCGSIGFLMR